MTKYMQKKDIGSVWVCVCTRSHSLFACKTVVTKTHPMKNSKRKAEALTLNGSVEMCREHFILVWSYNVIVVLCLSTFIILGGWYFLASLSRSYTAPISILMVLCVCVCLFLFFFCYDVHTHVHMGNSFICAPKNGHFHVYV